MFFEKENQMYLITSVVVVTVKFNYHHDQRHRVIKHFLYSCFSCVKVWECCFHIPHHFWLNDLNLHIEKKQNWWYGKQQNFSTHKYCSRHLLFHTRPHTRMNVTTPNIHSWKTFLKKQKWTVHTENSRFLFHRKLFLFVLWLDVMMTKIL